MKKMHEYQTITFTWLLRTNTIIQQIHVFAYTLADSANVMQI